MKDLQYIIHGIKLVSQDVPDLKLRGKPCFDSRAVEKGDLFVAVPGAAQDGHQWIENAIEKGAEVIVCERLPENIHKGICYIQTKDSHEALAIIASNFYGNPSGKIKLVGVTGTNGKTTTASLLYEIAGELGYKAGMISTIRVKYPGVDQVSTHTTPDPLRINQYLAEMVDLGCEFAFMEVSSHAIHQKRISRLTFSGGIFTNITHDHLDYHKTFREYLITKKSFFDSLPAEAFALVNKDDRNGSVMMQNTRASKHTYSLKSDSDFRGKILESHFEGNKLSVNGKELWTMLPGTFNAYNCLAIYGAGILLGFGREELQAALSSRKPVEGRFEVIRSASGKTAIVDYAHTPDAVENVLNTIRSIRQEGQKIITVVGAGGNRDKTKRPEMAKIAAGLSDRVILTSDNPRFEEPSEILKDMQAGVDIVLARKVTTISDREEAIRTACMMAEANDIILVAGKGHETYQEVRGVKYPFDDRVKVQTYL